MGPCSPGYTTLSPLGSGAEGALDLLLSGHHSSSTYWRRSANLVAMVRLFRLSGAIKRDPAIEDWFGNQKPELGSIARKWLAQMRGCGLDVREVLHDGHPTVCVQDAAFCYVNAFTAHVNVGFFTGALLPDPSGLLEGTGRRMRHVKLKAGREVEADALNALITAAYLDINARLHPSTRARNRDG